MAVWPSVARRSWVLSIAAALLGSGLALRAETVLGPWEPKFKGVDYSVSTNFAARTGDLRNLQVVHTFRVDLNDPDVRLLTTPPLTDQSRGEVGGLTVSGFLRTNAVQAAINANFFGPGGYYLPAGTPMDVYGLAISEGTIVSAQDGSGHAAVLLFDAHNHASIVPTNWPAIDTTGFYTAVAGNYPLVVGGKSLITKSNLQDVEPRTVFGISQDRRYLYLVAIDGRQSGYSEGATDYESAIWLLLLGASDGINLDGGGSTTLVIQDSTGAAVRLNSSSAVADSGRERTVGSHFGIYAKPLPGFINEVVATPEDTTAQITWSTTEPATSEVQYGTTQELGQTSGIDATLTTNHLVQLTGLATKTAYYFRVLSTAAEQEHLSALFSLTTTNYVTVSPVFGITNSWKFTAGPFNDTNWITPDFDDSSWSGPGAGLLWIDVNAAGPNPDVEPKNTPLPAAESGFPYRTYYFRSQFELPLLPSGSSLTCTSYVDDGAVFYLNGAEIYRLRLPAFSTSATLANGYPCSGSATCPDEFSIEGSLMRHARDGANVLAVEVHNYNAGSPDITFGLALTRVEPASTQTNAPPTLEVLYSAGTLTLLWQPAQSVLQSAENPQGPWTDLPSASPFVTAPSESHRYFRLRQ